MPTKQNENADSNAQTQYMRVCIMQWQEAKRASYLNTYGEILLKLFPQRAPL